MQVCLKLHEYLKARFPEEYARRASEYVAEEAERDVQVLAGWGRVQQQQGAARISCRPVDLHSRIPGLRSMTHTCMHASPTLPSHPPRRSRPTWAMCLPRSESPASPHPTSTATTPAAAASSTALLCSSAGIRCALDA
jgi:hypothetical protein